MSRFSKLVPAVACGGGGRSKPGRCRGPRVKTTFCCHRRRGGWGCLIAAKRDFLLVPFEPGRPAVSRTAARPNPSHMRATAQS